MSIISYTYFCISIFKLSYYIFQKQEFKGKYLFYIFFLFLHNKTISFVDFLESEYLNEKNIIFFFSTYIESTLFSVFYTRCFQLSLLFGTLLKIARCWIDLLNGPCFENRTIMVIKWSSPFHPCFYPLCIYRRY